MAFAAEGELKLVRVYEKVINNLPVINIEFDKELDASIDINRHLTVKDPNNYKVYGGWVIDEDGKNAYFPQIEPKKKYTLEINSIRAKDMSLITPRYQKHEIETKHLKPRYGFASQGSILPKDSNGGLPIMTVNVDAVDVEFLHVKPHMLPKFLDRYYLGNITPNYYMADIHNYATSVYKARFDIKDKTRDKRITSNIELEPIRNIGKAGMYVAVMKLPGVFEDSIKTSYFFISDIGLHARKYKDHVDVYAISLQDGSPLEKVDLKLYNYSNLLTNQGVTDNRGYASIKLSTQQNTDSIIIARKGEQISYLKVNTSALDLSEFLIDGAKPSQLNSYIFSNRDLFRPGETVPLSILLRDNDGNLVEPRPLFLTISDPSGAAFKQYNVKPGSNGYLEKNVWIPENAKTGRWSATIHTHKKINYSTIGTFDFKVEEFLPERIKLELKSEEKTYLAKQKIDVDIEANYLYGAPASKNRAKATTVIKPIDHPIKKYKKFFFGNHKATKRPVRQEIFSGKLDEHGKKTISFIAPNEVTTPLSANFVVSVFESGGRAINRSIKRQIWPAKTIIGVRPVFTGDYAPQNQKITFEVINVDGDSKIKSLDDVSVRLIYEERRYHWFYDEQTGWDSKYTQLDHEKYSSTFNIKSDQISKITVPSQKKYGRYRLEVLNSKNNVLTSYRFRLGWFADEAEGNRPNKVTLGLDKPGYSPGEKAILNVKPPHAGNALILVESNKRLFSKTVYIPKEGKKVEIPIDDSWNSHDIYVSAVVFRKASKSKLITPQRAMGIIHLPLDRSKRKLDISLETAEKIVPNKEMELKIKIPNTKGKKAWVKVSATDVGILNITSFKTPDPFTGFFAKRRYGVDSYDMYSSVIENRKGKLTKQRFGGDADMSGKRKNRLPKAKVKLIAFTKELITTDENGYATIKFNAPDFNGTIKITAIAFTEDSFGSAETETTVASPIIAEISTPKFLADNDAAMIALDIQNLSGENQDVEFELTTSAPLKISEYSANEHITNSEKKSFFFEISADGYYGIGKIRLKLKTSAGFHLLREWELAIRPAFPSENRNYMSKIDANGTISLDKEWIAGLSDKTTEVNIVASPTPPFNLNSIAKGLFGYPYGCLEQTTSKAFANLFIDDNIAAEIGMMPIAKEQRIQMHEKAVSRLAGMQLSSGAFALWSNNGPEQPWLSAYVADYLLTARDKGFEIPDKMLNRLMEQLSRRIEGSTASIVNRLYTNDPQHLTFAADAYAAYVLSKLQRINLSSLRNMYEFRKTHSKSGLPLVHLGAALITMGDKRNGMSAIKDGLKQKRTNKYLGDYGSVLRDTAQILNVLNTNNIKIENDLLLQIWQESQAKRYLSTQERTALLRAGFSEPNTASPFTVAITQELIEERKEAKRFFSQTFTAEDVNLGTEIKFLGDKDIFVFANVSGFPAKAPKPNMKHFEITRSLYSMDGKPLDKKIFASGDMVIAHLRIRSDSYYDNAMVIDLVPAGLEIENLNISQGEGLGDVMIDGLNPAKTMQRYNIKHIEFRDDRYVAALALNPNYETHLFYILRAVSPGVYTVPPAFVEDMYRPQYNGTGITAKPITVHQTAE